MGWDEWIAGADGRCATSATPRRRFAMAGIAPASVMHSRSLLSSTSSSGTTALALCGIYLVSEPGVPRPSRARPSHPHRTAQPQAPRAAPASLPCSSNCTSSARAPAAAGRTTLADRREHEPRGLDATAVGTLRKCGEDALEAGGCAATRGSRPPPRQDRASVRSGYGHVLPRDLPMPPRHRCSAAARTARRVPSGHSTYKAGPGVFSATTFPTPPPLAAGAPPGGLGRDAEDPPVYPLVLGDVRL